MTDFYNNRLVKSNPVKISLTAEKEAKKNFKPFSRKPAALFGIILTLIIGAFLFFDFQDFLGSLTSQAVTIPISNGQIVSAKQNVTVQHGQKIVWINNDPTGYQLVSLDLCDNKNNCFNTVDEFFQGESASFVIPDIIPAGTYHYHAAQDPELTGSITVKEKDTEENRISLFDYLLNQGTETDVSVSPSEKSVTSSPVAIETNTSTVNRLNVNNTDIFQENGNHNQALLPVNPYSIDSGHIHPYDSEGNKDIQAYEQPVNNLLGAVQYQIVPPVQNYQADIDYYHQSYKTAVIKQPETGPKEAVLVVISAIMSLILILLLLFRNRTTTAGFIENSKYL